MQGAQTRPRKVPVDGAVGELHMPFSEKIYNKAVSKGVKKDPALTVVGTI